MTTATVEPVNQPVWSIEGHHFNEKGRAGSSVKAALKEADMDWTVRTVPIYAAGSYVEKDGLLVPAEGLGDRIEDKHGVQRESDGRILGVVGNSWTPVQNNDGFALVDDFLKVGGAHIESMGEIDGGRKVWMQVRMNEDMFIAGEEIATYVLFLNGHDGRTSVMASMLDVRFFCMNCLDFVKKVHRVRHTSKATSRLAEAKQILRLRDLRKEELAKQGEWLVKQEMSDKQFSKFLEELMPVPEEQENKPAETMIKDRRDQIHGLYMGADNLNNIRGTRWGALNAVIEYSDHGRKFRDDNTQMKAQLGLSSTAIKTKAAGLLTTNAPKAIQIPV